jgi:hypothetical protein
MRREAGIRSAVPKALDVRTLVLASTILTAAVPLVAQSQAQQPKFSIGGVDVVRPGIVPSGPAPRLPDGTPDLSGVWLGGGALGDIAQGLPKGERLPLLPWADALTKTRQAKDDPESNCLPTGVPRMAPYPWRIIQHPTHKPATHIFVLFEGNIHSYRQIFMDGRRHPQDLDPTWYGHSIGRWDGATLVIDTVGYNDKFWFDFLGHPHTEQLHTVERWTRTNMGTLVTETTIDDPGAYSKPFTVTFTANLMPLEHELMEYICNENNQSPAELSGPAIPPGGPR